MGVTVQLMVDAAVSGVLFTCNPVSGDPSVVAIDASWGLGLSVVGGEVTPDQYLVSKITGDVVRRTVGDKAIEYVAGPERRRAGRGRGRRVARGASRASTTTDLRALVDARRARSSATSAPTRTSSGRSTATACCSSSRPDRSPRREKTDGPKGVSAMSLIMGTFGVGGDRAR